jgi:hypothetical protein
MEMDALQLEMWAHLNMCTTDSFRNSSRALAVVLKTTIYVLSMWIVMPCSLQHCCMQSGSCCSSWAELAKTAVSSAYIVRDMYTPPHNGPACGSLVFNVGFQALDVQSKQHRTQGAALFHAYSRINRVQ